MNKYKFSQLLLSNRLNANASNAGDDVHENFFVTYGQRNDDKDNQIIKYANDITRRWKQSFGDDNYGNDYAFGLYQTYSEIVNKESKLNQLTQDYILHNFKDEASFRCYYMKHKNAPKSSLNKQF